MARLSSVVKQQKPSSTRSYSDVDSILVAIDASIPDSETLASSVVTGAIALILDPEQDGIAQITQALQQHPTITNLHIVSQGAPGVLYLGNTQLSSQTLDRYSWDLQAWFASPLASVTSALMLCGCNVAEGSVGDDFMNKLQYLTGARIAAL